MFWKRISLAWAMALATVLSAVGPASAGRPTATDGERPLTRAEQAASDRRVAQARAYLARVDSEGSDLGTLSCVEPTGGGVTTASSGASTDATTSACTVPQGYLTVEARDQVKSIYCGPAVGQVIANYSWAMKSGYNKYTQGKIAGWMATDTYGGTDAHRVEDGLEAATVNSPRRPSNWDWVVTTLTDGDRDGTVGDDLQGYVRSNVSGSKMPLAIPVKPHDPDSSYHLISWPKPVVSIGHWIGGYGWYGNYNGTDFSRIYYTDSSRDEGGATGKFWDPTRHIAILMLEHTRRFVW